MIHLYAQAAIQYNGPDTHDTVVSYTIQQAMSTCARELHEQWKGTKLYSAAEKITNLIQLFHRMRHLHGQQMKGKLLEIARKKIKCAL